MYMLHSCFRYHPCSCFRKNPCCVVIIACPNSIIILFLRQSTKNIHDHIIENPSVIDQASSFDPLLHQRSSMPRLSSIPVNMFCAIDQKVIHHLKHLIIRISINDATDTTIHFHFTLELSLFKRPFLFQC